MTNGMNAMKKALKLKWSEDMEKDFKDLKAEFTAKKIQAYPVFDLREPFIHTMDWSALSIAGILSQKTGRSGAFYQLLGQEVQL